MKKGWKTVPLEAVAVQQKGAIKIGPFGSQLKKCDFVSSGVHVVGIENVLSETFDGLGERFISPQKFQTLRSVEILPGDLLITMMGTIGKVAVVPDEIGTSIMDSHLLRVRPDTSICRTDYLKWAVYGCPVVQASMDAQAHGAIMKGLNSAIVRSLPVVLPPLAEQQRIVRLLDKAFAGLATAKANAEKNLQNARALFESRLRAVFMKRGEGWVERTVKQIAAPFKGSIRTGPFGSQLLHSEFVDEGIAVLGIDNAVANEFRWGKSRFITPEKYRQLERYTVHPGDVLITIMGTCGRCAIVPDDIPTAINTKHICCITLDRKQCLPGYLHLYFLYAPQSQEYLTKHAKGAIMAGLNMGIIQELPVMLPPIIIQDAITETATALAAETLHLESICQRKLAALDELKQSLLHKAFSGEL